MSPSLSTACDNAHVLRSDVKPHNFVLDRTMHVRLIDFGSAAPLILGSCLVPPEYGRILVEHAIVCYPSLDRIAQINNNNNNQLIILDIKYYKAPENSAAHSTHIISACIGVISTCHTIKKELCGLNSSVYGRHTMGVMASRCRCSQACLVRCATDLDTITVADGGLRMCYDQSDGTGRTGQHE